MRNFKLKHDDTVTLAPPYGDNNNILCLYYVTDSNDAARKLLRINHFDFELDYDFLIIGYGDVSTDKSTELAILTGQPKLRTIVSPGNVWLTLVTDSSGPAIDYNIDFRIIYDEESLAGKLDSIHNRYWTRESQKPILDL